MTGIVTRWLFLCMELIELRVEIQAPLDRVWDCFTNPEHIVGWNFAMDDWHCPTATSEFKVGGKFSYKMAAKDGSFSFDYWGIFQEIEPKNRLKFSLGEDLGTSRYVEVIFSFNQGVTLVVEKFVPEADNPIELQQQGWQLILDNFKKYCESL